MRKSRYSEIKNGCEYMTMSHSLQMAEEGLKSYSKACCINPSINVFPKCVLEYHIALCVNADLPSIPWFCHRGFEHWWEWEWWRVEQAIGCHGGDGGGGGGIAPLILALWRQMQEDLWVQGQPGLQSEFQNRHSYTEKPYLDAPMSPCTQRLE